MVDGRHQSDRDAVIKSQESRIKNQESRTKTF